jgi:hypothetical protein
MEPKTAIIMHDYTTAIGTISGTLLSVILMNESSLINTLIVASVGATTSFFVTKLWGYIFPKKKED